MSSWKNATKTKTRAHRERHQPASRSHLGLLEKKKDYKIRAEDFQRKQKTIKLLKQKALDKNPDEFYFNMVRTEKKEGVHQLRESAEPEHTEAELKLMFSQDQRYVNMKRSSELKKIERLKSSLHMIDSEDMPNNKHTIFVDSKKQVKQFDAAKYFNTDPAYLNWKHNRPTLEALQSGEIVDAEDIQAPLEKSQKYRELKKRIEREKELNIIAQKMERKRHLLKDSKLKKELLSEETKSAPAQYKWMYKRKR